ncbi:hypothetical protein LTR12_006318 [Friedmanniomyces endolithicus]|nr:hypothetical protein LTR74_000807 [Friedmanniomyces endolithicus]KAK1819249.1 hypothetical protein LTR12_006318 [Friedmanniomyces endolithicus]
MFSITQDDRRFGERKAQGDARITSIKEPGTDHDGGYEVQGPDAFTRSCHSSGEEERDDFTMGAEQRRPHNDESWRHSQRLSLSQTEAWYEYENGHGEEGEIEYTEHDRGKHEGKDSFKDGMDDEKPG